MHELVLKAAAILASIGLLAGSGAAGAGTPPGALPDDDTSALVEEPAEAARTVVGACEYIQAGSSEQYQFWCGGVRFIFKGSEEELAGLLALLPNRTPEEIAALMEGEDAPAGVKHVNRYGPLAPGQVKNADAAAPDEVEDAGAGGKGKAQAPGQLKKVEQAPSGQGGQPSGGKGGKK